MGHINQRLKNNWFSIRKISCQNLSTSLAPDCRVPGQPAELGVYFRESAELFLVQIAENFDPHLM
jgi:hypothetical protein